MAAPARFALLLQEAYSTRHPVKIHIALFDFCVTEITHKLKIIEFSEHVCHPVLLKE